jgi:hypothetical protein
MKSRRRICDPPHWFGRARKLAHSLHLVRPKLCGSQAARMSVAVQVFGRRQDVLSTRSCGRRPKSAKARNRGGWGTGGAASAMGICAGRACPCDLMAALRMIALGQKE